MTALALCAKCAHDRSLHVENGCLTCDCKAMEIRPAAPDQCPAVNDGMEGVRCHGDVGHVGLHWADITRGGDVSEWGDDDELWDEIDRLRAVIESAPHAEDCRSLEPRIDLSGFPPCTCWKADALG